jgi:gamma-glutamyltranspeptidase / glutathione hydrolase
MAVKNQHRMLGFRLDGVASACHCLRMSTMDKKGVVAAGHPVTASAAAEVLSAGGNAFDAAIAGLFAATVAEPVLASLGGGGFLMAQRADQKTTLLYDFFVDAPRQKLPVDGLDFRNVLVDFGTQTQEFHIGVGASAVPGFVPGLFAVHGDLGTLPMPELVAPAVRDARAGVIMTDYQGYLFSIIPPILSGDPAAADIFAPAGALLSPGGSLVNSRLADTLEALGQEGERLFTDGEIGQAIVRQSRALGGHLRHADLGGYAVYRRQPLNVTFDSAAVALNPAPSAGGPLIGYGLGLLDRMTKEERRSSVWLARVMAATNAVRRHTIDAGRNIESRSDLQQQLEEMRDRYQAARGTTHISVIDAVGNVASATVSNGEGNGVMVDDYGFMLNNMLGEEDLNPAGFHGWQPGQRLASMMAPTILTSREGSQVALGSGGSNRIRSAVLQVTLAMLDRGLGCTEAVASPRLHVEKCGNLSFEAQLPDQEKHGLLLDYPEAREWPQPNMFFGGVNVVARHPDGSMDGAGDPRRQGAALVVS